MVIDGVLVYEAYDYRYRLFEYFIQFGLLSFVYSVVFSCVGIGVQNIL